MRSRPTSQTTDTDSVYAVVESIADLRGSSPLEIEPLAKSVDPELIGKVAQASNRSIELTFEHEGCEVTVTPMGYRITPDDGPGMASSW